MVRFCAGLCFIVSPTAKMPCQGRPGDPQKLRRAPLVPVGLLVNVVHVPFHRAGQREIDPGLVRLVVGVVC